MLFFIKNPIYLLGIQMKSIQFFAITAILIANAYVLPANAGVKVDNLLEASSDTNQCKLLPSNPNLLKKVATGFALNPNKGLVADVYMLNEGVKNPSWFYIVKDVKTKKTVANIYLAYEGSNYPYGKKMQHAWQPAIGTCGGFKTQRVIVGNHINKTLGNFFLTQPVGDYTTQVPNYKSLRIQ
jgi:hypothetical protein